MLYSQRAWNHADRAESTYSTAHSETASEYSRRAWDDTASVDEDVDNHSRPVSPSASSRTHNQTNDDDYDTVDTAHDNDHLAVEPSLQRGMSVLGPKTRFVTRAPWEPGGDDDLEEEADAPEAETRSLFGGRGRSKKPKEPKQQRGFPASFVPRASSSSRPSVDVSTPTSSSSGGRFHSSARPGSAGTGQTHESDALPFPSPRFDKPMAPSLRSVHRNTMDGRSSSSHPYANPEIIPSHPYADTASIHFPASPSSVYPPSPASAYPPLSPRPSKSTSGEHPPYISNPVPTRDVPPALMQSGLPQKMAPWQFNPDSPTFKLVSLEEAQALKARQRQMSLPATEASIPRSRAISGPSHKSSLPPEQASINGSMDDVPTGNKTLKGRRSLMGLFARGKEKERSPSLRPESPPPVPSLPSLPSPSSASHSSSPAPPSLTPTPTTATPQPHRQASTPQLRQQRKIPPPSLNVVVTSPQPPAEPQTHQMMPPPPIRDIPKSATPPPSMPSRARPPKQTSSGTLSPVERQSHKPNSAPSNIQGFQGLSLRPVSTMFSSMPTDYLANANAAPLPTTRPMSNSASGQFSTQSPTTPSLWSSRSESISTGSSEMPPLTPNGLLQSLSSGSSLEGGVAPLSIVQKQNNPAEMYKSHIADLEAQVRALKAEVSELRKCPCPSCGYLGGGSSGTEKGSVLNRPRAKTGAGSNRVLFGAE